MSKILQWSESNYERFSDEYNRYYNLALWIGFIAGKGHTERANQIRKEHNDWIDLIKGVPITGDNDDSFDYPDEVLKEFVGDEYIEANFIYNMKLFEEFLITFYLKEFLEFFDNIEN